MAPNGFTLIELLVVVTIIVVLLALLTPALDKAIYQAELVACAAKLDAVGTGLTGGAAERQRHYPVRLAQGLPISVNIPITGNAASKDDRPALRAYLGASLNKVLNDPLTKAVDIDASKTTTSVQGSYALWFSWTPGLGQKTLRKLGDRWTWSGGPDGAPGTADDVRYEFNVLAQDYHQRVSSGPYNLTSHADRDSVLSQYVVQDAGGVAVNGITAAQGETTSGWLLSGGDTFGLLDYNVAYSDGSVIRLANVPRYGDEVMATVPVASNANNAAVDWYRVPKP